VQVGKGESQGLSKLSYGSGLKQICNNETSA